MSGTQSVHVGRARRVVASVALIALMGCAAGSGSVQPPGRAAQAPSLIGAVLDVESGKRLASCSLTVLGTKVVTRSDENGRFRLTLPDASPWSIQARADGYDDQVRSVRVPPGQYDTLVFRLRWRSPMNGLDERP